MTDAINHYTDINVCLFMHRYRKSNHGSSISILLRFLFCFPLSLFCIIIYLQSPFFSCLFQSYYTFTLSYGSFEKLLLPDTPSKRCRIYVLFKTCPSLLILY